MKKNKLIERIEYRTKVLNAPSTTERTKNRILIELHWLNAILEVEKIANSKDYTFHCEWSKYTHSAYLYEYDRLVNENRELRRQKISLENDNISLGDDVKKLTEEKEKKIKAFIVVKGFNYGGDIIEVDDSRVFYDISKAFAYQKELDNNLGKFDYTSIFKVEIGGRIPKESIL